MHRTRLAVALLAMLFAVAASHAQSGYGGIANTAQNLMKNFDIADKNHDGLLTRKEAEKVPFIKAHFDQIDTTHRGSVSKQEVRDYISSLQRPAPAGASTTH
ncbi:EF-hand domain-containing protein [Dyella sp. Tek66A03]|jgi:Ca2+-binding EF-hand superfamily protein|uniref:EF-hand domain-containing protein n=1 Tax=Dyella sp. Tek66A03 TaxID=3458298 RepID=UPI00403EA066